MAVVTVVPDPVVLIYYNQIDDSTTPNPFVPGALVGSSPIWDSDQASYSFAAVTSEGRNMGGGAHFARAQGTIPSSVIAAIGTITSIAVTLTAKYDDDHHGTGVGGAVLGVNLGDTAFGTSVDLTQAGSSDDVFRIPDADINSINTYTSSRWTDINSSTVASAASLKAALASGIIYADTPLINFFYFSSPDTTFSTYATVYQLSLEITYTPNATVIPLTSETPPLRIHPRDDGLGTSTAGRVYPPSKSIQASNRIVGGYL